MADQVQFETPENVQIAYQPAGLGTRFLAWFADSMILSLAMFFIFLVLVCAGIASERVMRDIIEPLEELQPGQQPELPLYFVGVATLVWGFGSFAYFGLSELLLRGQTIGKRLAGIRVVKMDGFSLDPGSILLRNIFRVLDHLPPLWIVPLVSGRSQRLGDMVAGTLVVSDKPDEMSNLRLKLTQRPASESKFRFDATTLGRARPDDVVAVERLLERYQALSLEQRESLLQQMTTPLAQRMQLEPPGSDDRRRFLEEFLAAEYRRQYRDLG